MHVVTYFAGSWHDGRELARDRRAAVVFCGGENVRFPVSVAALALIAASCFAEEHPSPPGVLLPKGRVFWGVGGNVGFPTGDHANAFGSMIVELERVVSDTRGPGWLRGQLGFSVELVPAFLLSEGATAYGAGFNLMGRHYLARGRRLRPFLTLGAGLVVSKEKIPPNVANVNFTPQVGFGYLIADARENVYSVEVRFHHLSNGGLESPNPGINSLLVQFGVRFHAATTSARDSP
jgi:Lipid A 3-O-deacylase (PagL)